MSERNGPQKLKPPVCVLCNVVVIIGLQAQSRKIPRHFPQRHNRSAVAADAWRDVLVCEPQCRIA